MNIWWCNYLFIVSVEAESLFHLTLLSHQVIWGHLAPTPPDLLTFVRIMCFLWDCCWDSDKIQKEKKERKKTLFFFFKWGNLLVYHFEFFIIWMYMVAEIEVRWLLVCPSGYSLQFFVMNFGQISLCLRQSALMGEIFTGNAFWK